jgi:hypothetical protein
MRRKVAAISLRNGLDAQAPRRYVTSMALTNSERQARYRDRLKHAATQAPQLHIVMVDLILRTRLNIREWKRMLPRYESGQSRFYTNNVNATPEAIANLERMIAENSALLAQHDPDGLVVDGNIELAEIPACIGVQLWPSRPVSYVLNEDGLAKDLRVFPSDQAAQWDAASAPDRRAGRIADDGWSIAVG